MVERGESVHLEVYGERLFVYGSLCSGERHHSLISNFVVDLRPARARGSVYRLQVGYPVLVDSERQWIEGELVTLRDPERLFPILDSFHGFSPQRKDQSLFLRKQAAVLTEVSQSISGWAYFVSKDRLPVSAKEIPDGNWKKSLQSHPPLLAKLTERQISYIRKLGACSGREIVPIDLALYRELMSLEIIVDKGRRLALSRLGLEVYRYL